MKSAGILLYRTGLNGLEVLLVHPGGPFNARKDLGAWSIPKGLYEEDEDALVAAKREFLEELGSAVKAKRFIPLEPIKQKGNKIVHAWAAEGDLDVTTVVSNTFRMEYPYKSGKWGEYPEVDRAEWFALDVAATKMIPEQAALLDQLRAQLQKPE
jgi:predicted NUDIX family NTP pyrophosphohydrolase